MSEPLKCGKCEFAHPHPQMIGKYVCWGAPPIPQIVNQGGQMGQINVRPIVDVNDPGCSIGLPREPYVASNDPEEDVS